MKNFYFPFMHISQFFFSRGVAAAVLGHSQNENSGDENFRMLYTMSENSKDNFYEKTLQCFENH